jgi:hypothetical protein
MNTVLERSPVGRRVTAVADVREGVAFCEGGF